MPFDPRLDAYRELGLTPDATPEEIRRAYRRLARRYHPDHAPEGKQHEYEEKMKRVNAAYAVLRNPHRRAQYDQLRQNGAVTPRGPSASPTARATAPNDPYMQMRVGYQQRLYRMQVNTRQLPVWAQLLSGLFAGLGLVMGFLMGLPFGIVGCIPGALVGLIGGMLVGLFAVYLLLLGLPVGLLALGGYWALGMPGLLLGALAGVPIGWLWMRRALGRSR
ncbi:Chaperone protein DnaJ 1 [bacterium HR15]|nr:Chaperone protein DnaJ 1 [bacterium HR15]